jgi:DNA-binding CsgD family transcriptional regulator
MAANLQRIIDLAYSAAVQDVLWRDWTLALVSEFQTPGALFWVIDADRFDMCQNHMCFPDADSEIAAKEYIEEWVRDDPQMSRVCHSRRSEIYLDTDHVDLTDPAAAAYTKWQESIVGTCHHITSSVALADGLQAGVSLHFSREQGPADRETQEQIRSLFPQFARALQLGYRHSEAISENWWEGISAISDQPKILLNSDGKVIRLNGAAEIILARCDGLRVVADRLICEDTASEVRLSGAIASSCRRLDPKADSVAVRRKGGRSPYLLSLYPLIQRRRFLAPFGASALVSITDPSALRSGLTDEQRTMLGLTERENQLATLIQNGHSVASASEVMGIAYNTVRIHLTALFHKTGTTRQSDLVRLLARIS